MTECFSIRNQSCPNPLCTFYNETVRGNVIVHGRKPARWKCTHCGKTWVSHRHEQRFGMQHDFETLETAMELISKGTSVRKTADALRISPSTVQRWKRKLVH